MVDPRMERLERHLTRLKLVSTRERLDGLLEAGAKGEMSFLEFLDHVIREEVQSKEARSLECSAPSAGVSNHLGDFLPRDQPPCRENQASVRTLASRSH